MSAPSINTASAYPDRSSLEAALALQRTERWEAAAGAFRELLGHDSFGDQARLGLGDCLLHLKRPDEALACFEPCLSGASRIPAMLGKAVALQMLRRFEPAEALFERLLELDPTSQDALGNLIAMNMELFDLSRVHRYALRLAAIFPQSTIALQALTVVALERRDYAAAARFFDDLIRYAGAQTNPFPEVDQAADEVWYRLSVKDMQRLSKFRSVHGPLTNSH